MKRLASQARFQNERPSEVEPSISDCSDCERYRLSRFCKHRARLSERDGCIGATHFQQLGQIDNIAQIDLTLKLNALLMDGFVKVDSIIQDYIKTATDVTN